MDGKSWTIDIFRRITLDTVTLNIETTVFKVVITVVAYSLTLELFTDLLTVTVDVIIKVSASSNNLSPLLATAKSLHQSSYRFALTQQGLCFQ